MQVDELCSILPVALRLASRGWHVFPCAPRRKVPLTTHGCLDASRDPAQLRAWWETHPDANLAVATGAISGIVAVDVDGPAGRASWARLEREHGPAPTLRQITGRVDGGEQRLYLYPATAEIGNRTGARPGIDVRGDGGYVLLPPSVHPSGQSYWWIDCGLPQQLPAWLLEVIVPRPADQPPAPRQPDQPPAMVRSVRLTGASRYVVAALERVCAAVRGLAQGGRAVGVYHHASCVGELVAGGALDGKATYEALLAAAQSTGLGEREADRQVRLGLESGRRRPRSGPQRRR